jgi:hypothetical protein
MPPNAKERMAKSLERCMQALVPRVIGPRRGVWGEKSAATPSERQVFYPAP